MTSSNSTTLTIIMTTINRGHLISYSIDSLVNQDLDNWKLVIIDNASTDDTSLVCNKYQDLYDNITYHYFDRQVPIHQNWERGLAYVDTDYFITLSDDDHLANTFVSQVVSYISSNIPDVLVVNRATYAPSDQKSLIAHKLIVNHPKTYSSASEIISGSDIWLPYLTCEVVKPRPNLFLHPSMFVYKHSYIQKLVHMYGQFYKPAAPDYYANIIVSLHTDNIIFLNKPLVCIGGLMRSPYCFSNNKFDWFGMIFKSNVFDQTSPELVDLVNTIKLFDKYPYFIQGILKQSLMTIYDIEKVSPEKATILKASLEAHQYSIIRNIFTENIRSYIDCKCHGDPFDKYMSTLSSIFSRPPIAAIKNSFISFLVSNLKPLTKFYFLSLFISFIHNLMAKSRWIPLPSSNPKCAAKALSNFVKSNGLNT